MPNTKIIKLTSDEISDLLVGKEVYIEDNKSGIEIHGVNPTDDLPSSMLIILDYIIENEYTSFLECCDCDIEITDKNYWECKCNSNKGHPYIAAMNINNLINKI